MGCDNVTPMCYVNISGPPVGSTVGCSSNVIQWDSNNDPNGKKTYASLLAAFLAGKQISIYVNSCSIRPTYPTIWYYSIYN